MEHEFARAGGIIADGFQQKKISWELSGKDPKWMFEKNTGSSDSSHANTVLEGRSRSPPSHWR